VGRGLGG